MDDERTQHTLDALADLFLTQAAREKSVASRTQDALHPAPGTPGSAPGTPGSAPGTPGSVEREPAALHTPHSTLHSPHPPRPAVPGLPGDDPLEGPAPIRLAPKAVATPVPPEAHPRLRAQPLAHPLRAEASRPELKLRYTGYEPEEDAVDPPMGDAAEALAQASESMSSMEAAPPEAMPAEAAVEAVILGSLPGVAGPWLTQYAQGLADQAGPVLILHVDEPQPGVGGHSGQIEVELVEPIRQGEVAPSAGVPGVRIPPMREGGAEQFIHMIDGLVRSRVGKVAHILVHLEADSEPARLSRLASVRNWTLLAGCDEFASAGVSRLLAGLIEAEPALAHQHVALMMMGSADAAARAAAHAIADQAGPLLASPIHWLGSQQKMSPVNVRQLGCYRDLGALWPPLLSYLRGLVPPAAQPVQQAPAPPPLRAKPEVVVEQGAGVRDQGSGVGVGVSCDHDQDEAVFAHAAAWAPVTPAAHVAIAPPPPPPAAPARPAARPTMPVSEPPSLARLVAANTPALAGGIALEARCPFQPDTELLLDQAGVLHLLRRDIPVAAANQTLQDETAALRAAIVDLVEARKWVIEHRQLLQLTQRNARFAEVGTSAGASGGAFAGTSGGGGGGEPVLHLLTDKPHLATGLVARLGDHIKLHLLQQLQVADHTAWYCTPLS